MGTSNSHDNNIASLLSRFGEKKLETAFFAIFSAVILALFYVVISMNGVVLGNDPAVHLEKSQIFLNTGQISLANLGWTPPLYEIVLAMFISLIGASDMGQMVFLVKALAVIIDWLLVLSVYLLASRYFSKRVGLVASVFLLMSFPMYEMNQFGGYTTGLALVFMLLVFLYTPLATENYGYLVVTFFAAFGIFLSHQLAAFLAVFIMPPILLFMLLKSKGKNLKVVMALVLGGGVAFFLYYFQAMIGYLDLVIEYVFFAIKAYAYQIPAVSFPAFMTNFGFIFFLALVGIGISFYQLRKQKKPLFLFTLLWSFAVPFFFAESYLVGLFLPFGWFIYYLTPQIAILGAVTLVFAGDKLRTYYSKHKMGIRRNSVKILTAAVVISLMVVVVYRSDIVYGRIMEASVYYSTTDVKAYDAGVWLKNNYADNATVVATFVPGFWFQEFSTKSVVAQTDQAVQRNEIAESVLTLSYEVESPQTLVKAYEAKGDISEETYIAIDQVWYRASYLSDSGNFLRFTQNGEQKQLPLTSFTKQVTFDNSSDLKKLTFQYTNEYANLSQVMLIGNDRYPVKVYWTITPIKGAMTNVSLYLTTLFDLQYSFDKAEIPGLMDWINPYDMPQKSVHDNWAVSNFTSADLKDSYLGLFDTNNSLAYAFKFNDLPDWGNIGSLQNRRIDALRFQYDISSLDVGETSVRSYEVVALSKNTYPTLQPSAVEGLFDYKPAAFNLATRDYIDYIEKNNIGFIVYDRNVLDTKIVHSKMLELVYSNDRYVILKIIR
jgi:hypothetical protein